MYDNFDFNFLTALHLIRIQLFKINCLVLLIGRMPMLILGTELGKLASF